MMVENPIPNPQNPSHNERVEERLETQKFPDNENHLNQGESNVETQNNPGQTPASMPSGSIAGPLSGQQDDPVQTTNQTTTGQPAESPYSDSAVIKAWKLEQQKIAKQEHEAQERAQEDQAKLQEYTDQLRQIQQDSQQQDQDPKSQTGPEEDYSQGFGYSD